MNKTTLLKSLALTLMLTNISAQAEQSAQLSQVEAQVEHHAANLDKKYGLLLSHQERQNLKLAIIVESIVTKEALAAGKSAQQLAKQAFETYQIVDIIEQNNLLAETELAMAKENGEGHIPPCCNN